VQAAPGRAFLAFRGGCLAVLFPGRKKIGLFKKVFFCSKEVISGALKKICRGLIRSMCWWCEGYNLIRDQGGEYGSERALPNILRNIGQTHSGHFATPASKNL